MEMGSFSCPLYRPWLVASVYVTFVWKSSFLKGSSDGFMMNCVNNNKWKLDHYSTDCFIDCFNLSMHVQRSLKPVLITTVLHVFKSVILFQLSQMKISPFLGILMRIPISVLRVTKRFLFVQISKCLKKDIRDSKNKKSAKRLSAANNEWTKVKWLAIILLD